MIMTPALFHLPRQWSRWVIVAIAALFGGMILPANAADFSATLSPDQKELSGITRLTGEQQSALNAFVAHELLAARQGGVTAFARTFVDRRSTGQRRTAGLDQLTAAEQDTLNDLVAAALAKQQAAPLPVSMLHKSPAPSETARSRLKVHGQITLTYGSGRDGSFYGGSLYTEVYDPETKVSLGVGISTLRGHVPWWQCDAFDPSYARGWGW